MEKIVICIGRQLGSGGRKIAKMLERKRMPFRRRIASPDQHLAVYLHKFLPARWNEAILRSYYIREGRK